MRYLKRSAALFLTLMMVLSLTVTASAAVDNTGFSDVDSNAWYAEAVVYCREHHLMAGIDDNRFDPESDLTRAQLATVLYRIEGTPAVTGTDAFTDTLDNMWYSDAVLWASQRELVSGYGGGLFGPDDPVSREQMTTILWRYAGSPAADGANSFTDKDAIAAYAAAAVDWSSRNSIVRPASNGTFAPKSNATRAQVADALMNFDRTRQTAPTEPDQAPENDSMLKLTINGTTLTATLADNSSAQALRELLANGPITVDMRDYGSMEKVGSLGTSLPTNNEQINTQAGDIILYQGNQITIYYDTNSWSLTRLGKINNITAQELRELLGSGDVSVTLSLG